MLWARAHVLGIQGRGRARDEALARLESVASTLAGDGRKDEIMIQFPDGLSVSVGAALRTLRGPQRGNGEPQEAPVNEGPLRNLVADWAFMTDWQTPIVQILPIGGGDVILFDQRGCVYRVEGGSGKLIWRTTSAAMAPALSPLEAREDVSPVPYPRQKVTAPVDARLLPRCVADSEGNVFLPFREHVVSLSAQDGKPVWVAQMGGEPFAPHAVSTPVVVFLDGERVLAYNRATATASAFDRRNGKLVWERQIVPRIAATKGRSRSSNTVNDFSSGASFSAGRILVYGWDAAILDSRTGDTIWQFETGSPRSFPITLSPPDQNLDPAGGSQSPAASQWLQRDQSQRTSLGVNYLASSQSSRDLANFARRGGELISPASSWARLAREGRRCMGALSGNRLLLFGSGIDVLSLDLPLAGVRRNLYRSSLVGISGNKACFVRDRQLEIVNLNRGTLVSADLSWVIDESLYELQVTVSGARVYASGRNGILCLNLHSGGEIFRSPWPDSVNRFVLEPEADRAVSERDRDDPRPMHYWQGRVAGTPFVPMGSHLSVAAQAPQASVGSTRSLAACQPISNAVAGGRLFAMIAPHQVVALSEAEPDQAETSDANELSD